MVLYRDVVPARKRQVPLAHGVPVTPSAARSRNVECSGDVETHKSAGDLAESVVEVLEVRTLRPTDQWLERMRTVLREQRTIDGVQSVGRHRDSAQDYTDKVMREPESGGTPTPRHGDGVHPANDQVLAGPALELEFAFRHE